MQIRCPHCHQPIELVDDELSSEMTCACCGSDFNLALDGDTVTEADTHSKTIAHFTLIDWLGQGTFGSVWKALDTKLDREVAVKIPRKDRLSTTEAEQFLREARAAAQLRHPNIVPVHEVGREDGTLYIVSDLIEGLTLADWLTGQNPTCREAVKLCVTVVQALDHAHQAGIIHRDLKPGNIMLDTRSQPHIMDFGLARRETGEITMTIEGRMLGTPGYMPPEQARGQGHHADRRSDLYSLGVVLFELLTGETPFRGNQRMLLHQVLNEEPPSPRRLNQSVPRDLETITLKCLQKNPDQRYQTAAELAADLSHWLAGEPITARPVSTMERFWRWCRRRPALAGMSAVALLLMTMLGIGGTLFAVQQAGIALAQRQHAVDQAMLRGWSELERKKAEDAEQTAENERQKAVAAQKVALASEQTATAAEAAAKREAENARRNLKTAERNAYYSDMLLAERDWTVANMGHLRALLDRHQEREDLKGFEWRYWDRRAHCETLTLTGHGHSARNVSFSPDGKRIAFAGPGNTVKVRDMTSGRKELLLPGHTGHVTDVAFSPDGKHLASASRDRSVKVWDAVTGQEAFTLPGHAGAVRSVCFSPDGKRLASAGEDSAVKLWDLATRQQTLILKGHIISAYGVCFSPDGNRLASVGGQSVKIWDAVTGQQTLTLKGSAGVSFHPDGTQLASASRNKTIVVWDATSGQKILTLKGHTEIVTSVCFSPDGTQLASAGQDNTVRMWNTATGLETMTLKGHSDNVTCVSFSPNGTQLASAGLDNTVKIWDATENPETLVLNGHVGTVWSAVFSPDGTRLASASSDRTVKVWDIASGQELFTLNGHTEPVSSVCFSPDGAQLASASSDRTVILWDVATRQKTITFKGHSHAVTSVSISPDGTRLASASQNGNVKTWDTATGQETRTFKGHNNSVWCVRFSPDGKQLASSDNHGTVKMWEADTGQETFTLTGHSRPVECLTFSPNGRSLASASRDRTVKIWNTTTGLETLTLKGHTNFVNRVEFSPDGTRLASASGVFAQPGEIRMWDAITGQETLAITNHAGGIYALAFSPDGTRLASAGFERTVNIWDTRPWTPELRTLSQARGLLRTKRDRVKSLEELQAELRSNGNISDGLRRQALDWAELFWKNRSRVSPRP